MEKVHPSIGPNLNDGELAIIGSKEMQAEIADLRAFIAAGAPAEKPKPVIGAGDPEAFFVLFCEANGYPSDSEIDEALRAAYYEGIKYCCTLAAQPSPAPIAGDVEKDERTPEDDEIMPDGMPRRLARGWQR